MINIEQAVQEEQIGWTSGDSTPNFRLSWIRNGSIWCELCWSLLCRHSRLSPLFPFLISLILSWRYVFFLGGGRGSVEYLFDITVTPSPLGFFFCFIFFEWWYKRTNFRITYMKYIYWNHTRLSWYNTIFIFSLYYFYFFINRYFVLAISARPRGSGGSTPHPREHSRRRLAARVAHAVGPNLGHAPLAKSPRGQPVRHVGNSDLRILLRDFREYSAHPAASQCFGSKQEEHLAV